MDMVLSVVHARFAISMPPRPVLAWLAVSPTWCSALATQGTMGQGLYALLAKSAMLTQLLPERALLVHRATSVVAAGQASLETARSARLVRLDRIRTVPVRRLKSDISEYIHADTCAKLHS